MNDYVELHQKLAELVTRSARTVAPLVFDWLRPRSVLDVGCGNGTWLAAFRKAGVAEIVGVDGDYIDRAALEIPADTFQTRDLQQPFDLGRRFDLVVSLEVAEHLPTAVSTPFVESLTTHGDAVLFSAAIPGQGGVAHINEQWQSFWVERFQARGFKAVDIFRSRLWTNSDVAYWYAQNMILFIRESALANYTALPVPSEMPWDVVHPTRLTAVVRALPNTDAISIKQGFRAVVRGLRRRLIPG